MRDDRHRRVGLEVLDAGGEGVGDAVGEQRAAGDAGDEARDELLEAAVARHEHHAGLRAELPDAERERPDEALRERLAARRERPPA